MEPSLSAATIDRLRTRGTPLELIYGQLIAADPIVAKTFRTTVVEAIADYLREIIPVHAGVEFTAKDDEYKQQKHTLLQDIFFVDPNPVPVTDDGNAAIIRLVNSIVGASHYIFARAQAVYSPHKEQHPRFVIALHPHDAYAEIEFKKAIHASLQLPYSVRTAAVA